MVSTFLNRALATVIARRLLSDPGIPLERLGTDYGGWIVPVGLFNADSICYSVGAGEDISFDLELMARAGCVVRGFDPTPRAIAHVANVAGSHPLYRFFPIGLWSEKKRMKFFAPANPTHVSHSVVNLQGTATFFEADCDRLSSIMTSLGHRRLDLLKIDIEGAEWEVLRSIIEDGIGIRVLCVEFDQPAPFWRVAAMTVRLLRRGYRLVAVSRWNYTFLRRTWDEPPR